ncbi:hypothetical protein L0F63_001138, partial [Massospora cicadina]
KKCDMNTVWVMVFTAKHAQYMYIQFNQPLSKVEHGIRLFLGDESPTQWEKTCEAQPSLFPHAVYVATNNLGYGWINIGFEIADEADATAKVCVEIALPKGKKIVCTAHTRWNKEKTLFISFNSLPTNLPYKVIEEELHKGLVAYGEIQQLKIQRFHLMPNLCTGKAIAVINTFPEVEEDLSRIPHTAEFHFTDGG